MWLRTCLCMYLCASVKVIYLLYLCICSLLPSKLWDSWGFFIFIPLYQMKSVWCPSSQRYCEISRCATTVPSDFLFISFQTNLSCFCWLNFILISTGWTDLLGDISFTCLEVMLACTCTARVNADCRQAFPVFHGRWSLPGRWSWAAWGWIRPPLLICYVILGKMLHVSDNLFF